jgi:hypothetical protein
MKFGKFIATSISEYLIENQIEQFKNKIEGGFLSKKQADELQKEIETNYINNISQHFNREKQDIRMGMFNYEHPIAEKDINGINFRITEGLIRNKRKTYLLYANGNIIGEFYSVSDIKMIIKYMEEQVKNWSQFLNDQSPKAMLPKREIYGTSGEAPPSWTVNDITIKITDVQKYLDENNIPVVDIPVNDVFHLCAHRNKTDKETVDRSERASLDYPIIVLKKNGKYHMILDGHHRLLKAKNNNIDKIKARVFNLEDAPDEYKKVFH